MSNLLDQAWEKVLGLPADQQDAVAAQILDILADEESWQQFFSAKRADFEALGEKALEDHKQGRTRTLDDLLKHDVPHHA